MIYITVKEPAPKKTGYRYCSVSMSTSLFEKIDSLAKASNKSRSEIINQLLTESIDHVRIVSEEET